MLEDAEALALDPARTGPRACWDHWVERLQKARRVGEEKDLLLGLGSALNV